MTKADRYVQIRATGLGSREAAREAGFAGGTPSPQARALWSAYEKVKDIHPSSVGRMREQVDRLTDKVNEMRKKIGDLNKMIHASELVDD